MATTSNAMRSNQIESNMFTFNFSIDNSNRELRESITNVTNDMKTISINDTKPKPFVFGSSRNSNEYNTFSFSTDQPFNMSLPLPSNSSQKHYVYQESQPQKFNFCQDNNNNNKNVNTPFVFTSNQNKPFKFIKDDDNIFSDIESESDDGDMSDDEEENGKEIGGLSPGKIIKSKRRINPKGFLFNPNDSQNIPISFDFHHNTMDSNQPGLFVFHSHGESHNNNNHVINNNVFDDELIFESNSLEMKENINLGSSTSDDYNDDIVSDNNEIINNRHNCNKNDTIDNNNKYGLFSFHYPKNINKKYHANPQYIVENQSLPISFDFYQNQNTDEHGIFVFKSPKEDSKMNEKEDGNSGVESNISMENEKNVNNNNNNNRNVNNNSSSPSFSFNYSPTIRNDIKINPYRSQQQNYISNPSSPMSFDFYQNHNSNANNEHKLFIFNSSKDESTSDESPSPVGMPIGLSDSPNIHEPINNDTLNNNIDTDISLRKIAQPTRHVTPKEFGNSNLSIRHFNSHTYSFDFSHDANSNNVESKLFVFNANKESSSDSDTEENQNSDILSQRKVITPTRRTNQKEFTFNNSGNLIHHYNPNKITFNFSNNNDSYDNEQNIFIFNSNMLKRHK